LQIYKVQMNRRILILLVIIFSLVSLEGMSQKWKMRRYEAIGGIGTTHYFGTIGGSADPNNFFGLKDLDILGTRPSFYGGVRYKIRPNMAVRVNYIVGFIHRDDANSVNAARNIAFTSRIMEPSAQFEYSIISEEQRYKSAALFNKRGMVNNFSRINFYIFAGAGGVFAKVKPLKDLENKASYDPANLKSAGLAIPAGGGIKFVLSSNFSFGFELGGRYTTCKYLDAYHPPAAKAKDLYYFGLFNVVYRVRTSRTGAPILFKRTTTGMF